MDDWQNESSISDTGSPVSESQGWVIGRSRFLWIGGLIVSVILFGVAGVAFFALNLLGRLSGEPLHLALEKLRQDSSVVERLGEPVELASWFPTGSVHQEGDRGEANLTFHVRGSREKAVVNVVARRIGGKWGLTSLEITFSDGRRQPIDVSESGGDELEAPRWEPQSPAGAVSSSMPQEQQEKAPAEEPAPEISLPAPSIDLTIPTPPQR